MSNSLKKGDAILFVHYGDNWLRGSEYCLLNTVQALQDRGYRPYVWCNSPLLAQALNNIQVAHQVSAMNILAGYIQPKWDFSSWYLQVRIGISLIHTQKPALVHINSAAPTQWMRFACRLTNTPFLVQLHANYESLKDRITLCLHGVPTIVGVSHASIDELETDGTPSSQLNILPNAINTLKLKKQKPLSIKNEIHLASSSKLVLSVGSLIKRKGHSDLFLAIAHLKKLGEDFHAAIIGEGPERQSLERLAKSLDIDNYIHFLGERHDCHSIMSGDADALISTSRDEVFGLVIAEAHLAQLPAIAPNIPGINSVIKHNETGILYRSKDIRSLVNSLLMLDDKSRWEPMLAKAMYRTETLYSLNQHTLKLIRLYQKSIDSGKPHYRLPLRRIARKLAQRFSPRSTNPLSNT